MRMNPSGRRDSHDLGALDASHGAYISRGGGLLLMRGFRELRCNSWEHNISSLSTSRFIVS